MLLEVDDRKTIGDIQEKFNECFPGLGIAFFRKIHHWEQALQGIEQCNATQYIGDIRKVHPPSVLDIKSWNKVWQVEKMFKKNGLNVQLYQLKQQRWLPVSPRNSGLTLQQLTEKDVQKI